jgi:hypothetical protein
MHLSKGAVVKAFQIAKKSARSLAEGNGFYNNDVIVHWQSWSVLLFAIQYLK